MAILARAMVTLASIKDVASTTRYYKLLSSTATAPSAPTTNPPDNTWSTTEPTYSSTSTNTLYFVDLTVFSDGDFAYSEVSKSTSYEAAKSAYNIAQNAKDVADSAQESIDNLEIGGRNLGLYSKSLSASPSKDNRYFGWRGGTTQIRTDGFTEQVSTQNYNGIKIYANSLGLKVSDTVTFSCNVRNDSSIQNKVDFFCIALNSSGTRDKTSKFLHIKAENVNKDGQDCVVTNIEPNSEKRIWVTLTWLQLAENLVNADGNIEFSFQSLSTDWTAGSMSYYAPKIEKGNVMTDWSPAPEDLDIDSLGGRNILLDGNFTKGFDKWSFNYSSGASMPEIVTEDGIKCCHYIGEIGKASQVRQNILDRIANDEVGQRYTVSFDIKLVNYTSGTTNPFLQVYFSGTYDDNGTQKYMGATWGKERPNVEPYNNQGWVHVVVSNIYFAYKPINEMWFMIYSRDWSGDLYFTNFKLEHGNKATDWTPAPEDITESIDNISIGGRNLLLDTATPHSSRTDEPQYIGNYTMSDYGKSLFNNTETEFTLSFDYEIHGDYSSASSTSRMYAMINGTSCNPANSIYIKDAPRTGHYVTTCKMTEAQVSAGTGVCRVRWNGIVSGCTYTITNYKAEIGNKATDWTPAPEDFEESVATVSNTLTDYINSTEIIVGTQTAATGSWTGVAGFSELRDGQQIAYWLPYAGSGNASLNLTLSDGTTTGAITVYYKGSTVATTHFTAGTVIHLTYRVNANVSGTAYTGWWADASYDSGNTYNRIRFENAILAKSAISASRFIVGDDSGFSHLVGGSVFDITKPILWATSAIQSGKTATTNYLAINGATLRNNSTGITLTQYQTCYLVGTLSGRMFTTNLTNFFTSTIPTSDDGYYYIALGYLYSTYQIYLYPEHPIYKFVDGEFKNLNQVAYEASVLASEAKDDIENLEVGGTNLILDGNFTRDFEEWTSNQYQSGATLPVIAIEDGKRCCHYQGTVGKYAQRRQNIFSRISNDEVGQRYTVSFDFKLVNFVGGGTNPYLKVYFTGNYDDNGTSKALYAVYDKEDPDLSIFNNQGWVRVVISNVYFNHKPTNMWFTIYSRDYSGDAYFTNVKLERGTKATDWSPAPEDIEYAMNNVSIESSADSFINYTFDGSKIYYPSTITLTPFINGNIEFSKWQYKLINGDTWIDVVSGSNGLTVESDNTLTISNSCSLFTDTCSAIVFKCLSNNSAFYSSKTIVREDDPTRVYNTVKTRVDQTDDNLSLIASATELAEYSTSSTLNSRLANVSVSSDEILMVVSQSVNNLSTANGIKGVYDEAVSYATNNIVVLNGKFYKAKKASTGKTPPNTTYWTDVTSQYSETTLKTAFSKIVALQDSITLQVSGSNGNSSINLTDGTLSLTVTDVANILANKELNLTSENGVINITGGGGVNIGTSSSGAITINSPNFTLNKNGDIESNSGVIGGWHITSQDLTRHSINLIEDYTSYIANNYNPWKVGRKYFVGDIISTNLIIPSNGSGNVTFDNYKCIENHTATDFQSQKNTYWELIESENYSVNNLTQYKIYNMDIDSYNSAISISEEHYDINDSSFDLIKSFSLSVDGLAVYSSISEVGTEVKYDGIYHRIYYGDDNSTLNVSSSGYLSLVGDKGVSINGFNIGDSQEVLSIGNGTITDAISVLYSNKSNALSKVTYNAANETIQASEMKEFSINIASSGRKAIGIIGCVVLGSSNACLCGFWLDGDTTAKVRIKNLSNTSIVCHPRVIILYVDND